MATLSGNKIKNTYQSLVKFSDNGNITVGAKQLTDGFGNNSPMFVSTTQVGIGVTPEAGLNLHVYGDAKIGSNLTVIGNLVVEGSTTTVGTDTLTVKDPLIVLANNNTSTDAVDIGFYGKYTPSSTTLYSGLFREALTGKYRLFKDLQVEPTTTVNTSGTGYAKADLVIGALEATTGTFSGNISSTGDLEVTGTGTHKLGYVPSSFSPSTYGDDLIVGSSVHGGITLYGTGISGINFADADSNSPAFIWYRHSTGLLEINAEDQVKISPKLNETSLLANADGSVELYYDNSKKLETTSTGVDVTGDLDVDDVISVEGSAFGRIEIGGNSGGYIDLKAPNSDDYDLRIITSSGGNEVTTATGDLIFNTAETLALTIDTSQDATFEGNIILAGTVDSRDVSIDGTKLDTIETNADVTDTTNVTLAGALMDSEVTNLAEVKAFDSTDYATAAQGITADAALPKAGGAMVGAITTNSTFDGRDVATDGTKLDGIEALADVTDTANVTTAGALMDSELTDLAGVKAVTISTLQVKPSEGAFVNGDKTKLDGIEAGATTDQTAAEIKTAYESNSNTNAFTDADETKLDGIEASADVTDATNVLAAGAVMTTGNQSIAGVKTFSDQVSIPATPSASTDAASKGYVDSQVGSNNELSEVLANGNTSGANDIIMADDQSVSFGDGEDLKIYHDGDNSFIQDTGTGDLYIDAAANFFVRNQANGEVWIKGTDGGVSLRYQDSQKLITTSTGISVTGTAKNNGIEIESGVPTILFDETDVTANWRNRVQSGSYKLQYASDGSTFSDILNATSTGVSVTGNLVVSGSITGAGGSFLPLAGGTMTGNTTHLDNVKSLYGTSSDLQIYHDGSNSYIDESGSGHLFIRSTNGDGVYIYAGGTGSSNKRVFANSTGSVDLYYGSTKRFETTSYGINVTGAIKADDYISIEGNTNPYLQIHDITNEEYLNLYSSDNESAIVYTQDTFKISSGVDFLNQTPRLTINSSGNATFEGRLRANNWFQGSDGTNTLFSDAYSGLILQTAGATANNNNSKIFFRNVNTTVSHTFDTNNGNATFAGSVGIGELASQGKLDILNNGDYDAHTGHGLAINSNAGNAFTSMYMGADDSVDAAYIQSAGRNTSFTTKSLLINPNGGNVGIGTTSPDYKLDIEGASPRIRVKETTSNTANTMVEVENSDGRGAMLGIGGSGRTDILANRGYINAQSETDGLAIGTEGTDPIIFYTQGVTTGNEKMRINSSGNVGIGDDTPSTKIDVYQSTVGIGAADFRHVNGNRILINPSYNYYDAYNHIFRGLNGTDTHLTIDNSGNVGIGTGAETIYGKVQITGIGSNVLGNGLNLTTSDYNRGTPKSGTSMVSYFGADTGDTYGAIQVWKTGVTAYSDLALQPNGGNVGIGTTSPFSTAKLQVKTATNVNLGFQQGTTETTGFKINAFNDAANTNIPLELNGSVVLLKTGETERMRIDSSGNVGIGKSPQSDARLHTYRNSTDAYNIFESSAHRWVFGEAAGVCQVGGRYGHHSGIQIDTVGNSTFAGEITSDDDINAGGKIVCANVGSDKKIAFRRTGANNFSIEHDSSSLYFYNETTTELPMRFFNNGDVSMIGGNVGIGTTLPTFQLSIENHATTTSTATMELDGKRTNGTDGSVGELIFSNNGDTFATVAGFRDGSDNKGSLQFQTQDGTFTTKMTISSEGNVGIGTTSPTYGKITVTESGSAYTGDYIYGGTSGSYGALRCTLSASNSPSFIDFFRSSYSTTVPVGAIVTSGSNCLYQSYSDYRMKENVSELTGALDKVNNIQPKIFNYKEDTETTYQGFIAHELQEVVPQAVSGKKDEVNEDGTPKYQGVDNSHIVPLLVGAIQELKAEIELLKTQINK